MFFLFTSCLIFSNKFTLFKSIFYLQQKNKFIHGMAHIHLLHKATHLLNCTYCIQSFSWMHVYYVSDVCVNGFLWGCCGRVGHSTNMECLVHIAYKAYFMRYSLVVTRTHSYNFWGSIISVTVLADRECIAILIFIAWLYMCVWVRVYGGKC